MLTQPSKVFLPISGLAFLFGLVYVIATRDEAGLTLMLTLSGVSAFAGVVLAGARQNEFAPVVPADAPPPEWRPVAPIRPVGGAGWGVAGALAAGLVVVGLVAPTLVALAGIVLGAATVVGWMASVSSERTGRRANLLPLGIPVVGMFTIFALMFFMSRVLLAVPSKEASTAIAMLVAVAILIGASIVALRPALSSKALIAILAVSGLLLTAGGVVAAVVGERETEHHGAAHEPVEVVAKNIQFLEKELHFKTGLPAEMHFENDDAVPHNVAIYTDESARQDIFVGEVIIGPNKSVDYKFTPPPPGTYFFRCDIHPAMAGPVKVDP